LPTVGDFVTASNDAEMEQLAIFDADMRAIGGTILCFSATTNPDGSPNLSPKRSLRVHDDEHLLFANIASPAKIGN
jgi:hypothetical protein